MVKQIGSLIKFLKYSFTIDASQLRTKSSLFFFNLLPDFYILSPLKNFILFLGGAGINIFGVYIKSPMICTNLKNLEIGKGNFINTGAYIDSAAKVRIGRQNQIGPFLVITTNNHDILNNMKNISLPVTIGDNCWLGASIVMNPGASIANQIIVGSGAVVSSKLNREKSLYVGVPAKFKKSLIN